ncbi:hypothetical protein LZ30DRAFT_710689 [Colletotrichum cereale]|nr:hypothetical protein LZ30DRAFT_710689 [Colletotrichum cereale]
MKSSLVVLMATTLLGVNAATRYNYWCTMHGYYNEHYTKQVCNKKYNRYFNLDYASRAECKIPESEEQDDWHDVSNIRLGFESNK